MPQANAIHLQMLAAQWPTIRSRLRAEMAASGKPAAEFAAAVLHSRDDFAKAIDADGNLPPVALIVAPRGDFAEHIATFAVGDAHPYAEHADAILDDPRPGHVHVLVFHGHEATRTQAPFAG